ncbi:MAG TPA: hypothetical protein PLF40_07055 [Kofleriaceae bacterium]|nr:hypothetical protein [Kofleriaceae bacterium]
MRKLQWALLASILPFANSAAAAPDTITNGPAPTSAAPATVASRADDIVIVPPQDHRRSDTRAAKVVYLNRCIGGCAIKTDGNKAQTNSSTIPKMAGTLTEFDFGDAAWNTVVACVRDLYAPYGVQITDTAPDDATAHVEVMVAGKPAQLGLKNDTLGIAPLTSDCSPQRNVLAFAFAGAHQANNLPDLCFTVAHEAGHVYGLDHAFECRDPMTYLTGCGQKHFLNLDLPCGEFVLPTKACKCSLKQNSHEKLTQALDVGTLPSGPIVDIIVPSIGANVASGFVVTSKIAEPRWLSRVELWINGWPYAASRPGASAAPVVLTPPRTLPDGILDLEIRAYDDLGTLGTDTLTVTKGVSCINQTMCAADQICDAGRCRYLPPEGQLGDTCDNNDQCVDHLCVGTGDVSTCSKICVVGRTDQCGDLACVASADGYGVCTTVAASESGGCCDAGTDSSSGPLLLGLLTLGLLATRRSQRLVTNN